MYVILICVVLAAMAAVRLQDKANRFEKAEKALYVVVALFFLVRFSIGQDTGTYHWLFYDVKNPLADSLTSHMMRNFLYTLCNYGIKTLFHEFRWFVLCSNLLILGAFTWVIFRHSRHLAMSLFLFCAGGILEVYYGSGLRAGAVMAIFIFAFYQFLPKKQYLLYELFCLIAFGFHETALLLLVVPFLVPIATYFRQKPVKTLLIMFGISAVLCLITTRGFEELGYYLIDRYGWDATWTHVVAYLRYQEFSILGLGMEGVFLIGILLLYRMADKEKLDEFTSLEMMTFLFSIAIYISLAGYSLMSRVSDMFQVIMVILIPKLISAIPQTSKRLIAFCGVALLNLFLLYSDLNAKIASINHTEKFQISMREFPYITVFDKNKIDTLYERQ